MTKTEDRKVTFTRENAKKCICWKCPVQANSKCIEENSEKMGDVMTTDFFDPEIVPGLYCSSGIAACEDIDTDKYCICPECDIYMEYNLGDGEPTDHYCKNGNAR